MDMTTISNTAINFVWSFLWLILLGVVLVAIIFVLMMILPYKYRVRVRELTGDKTRIIDDKAKAVKEQGQVIKWRLRKRNHFIPLPPAKAIHLTDKGKICVEAYFTPEGEYKYIIDQGVDNETLKGFTPLTTVDREFYANEMYKKEKYKKKGIGEFIMPIAAGVTILAVLILMLVFWEDIAQPGIRITETASGTVQSLNDVTEQIGTITEQQLIITEMLRNTIIQGQDITMDTTGGNNTNG